MVDIRAAGVRPSHLPPGPRHSRRSLAVGSTVAEPRGGRTTAGARRPATPPSGDLKRRALSHWRNVAITALPHPGSLPPRPRPPQSLVHPATTNLHGATAAAAAAATAGWSGRTPAARIPPATARRRPGKAARWSRLAARMAPPASVLRRRGWHPPPTRLWLGAHPVNKVFFRTYGSPAWMAPLKTML